MKAIKIILLPLIAFFAPIWGILVLMLTLIIVDTITGIWKSKKCGIPITSRGMSGFISKVFLYCGGVLLIFAVDKLLLNEILLYFFTVEYLATKCISMIFAFVELISINENWKAVKGFDLWSQFKGLASRAKEIKKELEEIPGSGLKKQ